MNGVKRSLACVILLGCFVVVIIFDVMYTENYKSLTQMSSKISKYFDETGLQILIPIIKVRSTARDLPNCSFPLLRQEFLKLAQFPSGLSWNRTYSSQKVLKAKLCGFAQGNENIPNCLQSRNVSKIAVIGDSNGRRYAQALLTKFSPCVALRSEGNTNGNDPEKKYFSPTMSVLSTNPRGCSGCLSYVKNCSGLGYALLVEYISMEYSLDTEITSQWYTKWYKVSTFI